MISSTNSSFGRLERRFLGVARLGFAVLSGVHAHHRIMDWMSSRHMPHPPPAYKVVISSTVVRCSGPHGGFSFQRPETGAHDVFLQILDHGFSRTVVVNGGFKPRVPMTEQ